MRLLEKIRQIERIHDLIKRKSTGTPKELATRLHISERAVYCCIDLMKKMNAPIYYCHSKKSYCYENQVQFSFGFISDQHSIVGGNSINELLKENDFNRLQNFCSEDIYTSVVINR